MYIQSISITNIRAITKIRWELLDPQRAPGWHVVAGDNGAGKSSFLRAVGLALVGPETAQQLRQPWEQWLTQSAQSGNISLRIIGDPALDYFTGKGKTPDANDLKAVLTFARQPDGVTMKGQKGPERYLWGKGAGWFSASYGPFRRFTGGDPETRRLFYQFPRLGRHLSLFDEKVALTECLEWLRTLRLVEHEGGPDANLLAQIRTFINQQDFLPFHATLGEITSSEVKFVDGNSAIVDVENLSDGYRSVLSMTFELIRQLAQLYGTTKVFDPNDPTKVVAPGVVLIDEVDAHLHPTWQRRIGTWFSQHFPRMQFIVTSHSPLVCQAADRGTVFRLPRPGYDEDGEMITGDEYRRLVYGDVLDAFGTEVFGEGVTTSVLSVELRERLAELNVKELSEALTANEKAEQQALRNTLPTADEASEIENASDT